MDCSIDESTRSEFSTMICKGTLLGNKAKTHLCSHSFKRRAVQVLSEFLSPHTFVERCGWMVKNVHSLFDYVFVSPIQDSECGKTLQEWTMRGLNNVIIGGLPPDLKHIKTSPEKLVPFVNALFSRLVLFVLLYHIDLLYLLTFSFAL